MMHIELRIRFSLYLLIISIIILNIYGIGNAKGTDVLDYSGRTFDVQMNNSYWEGEYKKYSNAIEIRHEIPFLGLVIFSEMVDFRKSKFNRPVCFYYVKFEEGVDFNNSLFSNIASFEFTNFSPNSFFNNTTFKSETSFMRSSFDSASFRSSSFESIASFEYSTFLTTTDFESTTFNSNLSFRYAKFGNKAVFREAEFREEVNFFKTTLPDLLDFRHIKDIKKEIDFTSAQLKLNGNKCNIALAGTNIEKLKLNMNLFELWFPIDTIFIDTVIVGDSLEEFKELHILNFDQKSGIYERVLNKLENDGLKESF